MYGNIGAPWTQPPSRSASAVSIRFWSRKLASKSLRPLPIRRHRRRQLRVHPAAADALDAADRLVGDRLHEPDLRREPRRPLERAGRLEPLPVVDEQRLDRLRQQDQQPVDVLARDVDHRQEARRPGHVGELAVPGHVVRPLARREREPPVMDLALDRGRERQPVGLRAVLPARRDRLQQLDRGPPARALDQPHALVVDHEEERGMGVVGARRRPARDVEEHRPELARAVRRAKSGRRA